MPSSFRPFARALALVCGGLLAFSAQARMQELNDGQLSDVTGQAFINVTTDALNGLNFTQINFGADLQTQLNIKNLQLGLYNRSGANNNVGDIDIGNFALGTVNDATGTVNPFLINDPYIQFAYSGTQLVGVRLGFGSAQGYLSGDIKSLTGNVPVDLYGTGTELGNAISCGINLVCLAAKGLISSTGDSRYTAAAQLVTSSGNPTSVRADTVGLANGTALDMTSAGNISGALLGILLPLLTSQNCNLLGATTCFPLSQYQSIPIGQVDPNNAQNFVSSAKGVFLSLQSQSIQWRDQQDPSKIVQTIAGAFMNIPRNADGSAAINLDFTQGFNGIPRQDTCLGGLNKGC
ncbi:DUF6160 family protein [Pseudomonas citronellolis]|uniref:DUF6160 family protein n=1 Tax=Pseudomonas citronellolis TaxID=53408 RepID=UPI0023E450CA|nr:DUF6160 family protein [Pseudomonas citronellolis]MDF3934056.1 hypothetical protein [Pseudomonas citronellolis]